MFAASRRHQIGRNRFVILWSFYALDRECPTDVISAKCNISMLWSGLPTRHVISLMAFMPRVMNCSMLRAYLMNVQ